MRIALSEGKKRGRSTVPVNAPASVYVHFPWCLQKCPYCDFASASITRPEIPHVAYADAVLRELDVRRSSVADRELVSVFFGGGTPSLWEPRELGRVLSAIRGAFASERANLEITVECNPSSFDRARASALRDVGVTRVSIGVQSLDEQRLRFLGRLHDAAGALRAIADGLAELPRVSGDLMFGMPGQSPAAARDEAARLADTGLRHLSCYALTIEEGTQFGALHRKGKLALAPEDDYADAFLAVEAALAERGLLHYEVSNYATLGEESVHNQHYWRGGAYLGLGAGAVGCLDEGSAPVAARRYRNDPSPTGYVNTAGARAVEVDTETLDAEMLVGEAIMLGLRTREGVDVAATVARTGVDLTRGREARIEKRLSSGDLRRDANHLVVPPGRWLALDGIVRDLF